MEELLKIREQIDAIDKEMLRLFEKRMIVSEAVAAYKLKENKKVYDKVREDEKIQQLMALATEVKNQQGIRDLFNQIMSLSRKKQYETISQQSNTDEFMGFKKELDQFKASRVVYQGVQGSYSEEAMVNYFGEEINAYHVPHFEDIMIELENENADYGILPIENSSTGGIHDVYDLLVNYNLTIVGEQIVKVDHALVALTGTDVENITEVYSHPQGFLQCKQYLAKYPHWIKTDAQNTAVSAKRLLEENAKNKAAIASKRTASLYGLNILEEHINYNTQNYTRFIVLKKDKCYWERANKVSVCFETAHTSGALYKVLSIFMHNNLNLLKIESRPIPNRQWEYSFIIDFEGSLEEASTMNAIYSLKEEALNFKLLGNYYSKQV